MSDKLKVVEINCTTGVTTERDMTEEEITNMQALQAEAEARMQAQEAEAAAKAEAKASALAKLAALGLTEEEVAAITN